MFRVGELDQRVTVLNEAIISDGLGGDERSFVEQGEYWCHVRPISGKEIEANDRLQGVANYLFVFRNGVTLKDSDRLDWQGEQFNIRFRKQPKSRDMYVQVEAERGVGQ